MSKSETTPPSQRVKEVAAALHIANEKVGAFGTTDRLSMAGSELSGSFPTNDAARRIAAAAKRMGFRVTRDAGGPQSRSFYVTVHRKSGKSIKIRCGDHPATQPVDIDVHVGDPRPGAVEWTRAVEWLEGKSI